MEKVTLFVALNHTLTPQQIEGFKSQFGNGQDCQIVTLASVNPELAAATANIDPMATLQEVQNIARKIIVEAKKVDSTHFCCAGEQTLAMWANLIASKELEAVEANGEAFLGGTTNYRDVKKSAMVCIQSTTRRTEKIETHLPSGEVLKEPKKIAVFEHCQWRELF